jgi:hypothetical protein
MWWHNLVWVYETPNVKEGSTRLAGAGVEPECLVVALAGGGRAPVPGRRLHVVKSGVYAFRVHNISEPSYT